MPLTRDDLNEMHCNNPACKDDHPDMFLVPNCHPGSGLDVAYSKVGGELKVYCNTCMRLVASIMVARHADAH